MADHVQELRKRAEVLRERRLELKEQIREARRRPQPTAAAADSRALLEGRPASPATETGDGTERLRADLDRCEQDIVTVDAELDALIRRGIPDDVAASRTARIAERRAAAELGRALAPILKRARAPRASTAAADDALRRKLADLRVGSPAERQQQLRVVADEINAPLAAPMTPEEVLGLMLLFLMDYLLAPGTPVDLEYFGLPVSPGASILYRTAAVDGSLLLQLRERRWPAPSF